MLEFISLRSYLVIVLYRRTKPVDLRIGPQKWMDTKIFRAVGSEGGGHTRRVSTSCNPRHPGARFRIFAVFSRSWGIHEGVARGARRRSTAVKHGGRSAAAKRQAMRRGGDRTTDRPTVTKFEPNPTQPNNDARFLCAPPHSRKLCRDTILLSARPLPLFRSLIIPLFWT